MKIGRAVLTIVVVTLLVGLVKGGMNFTLFGLTLGITTAVYLVVGMVMPYIPWVVFLGPMESAAVVFLGQKMGMEGPGGPILLIPFLMWIKEIVNLQDQSVRIGPAEMTTADLVEVKVSATLTHHIERRPDGSPDLEAAGRWAFMTDSSSREALLHSGPEGILRRLVARYGLASLGKQAIEVPLDEIESLFSRGGRKAVSLIRDQVDLPDALRVSVGARVAHRAEADGLKAIGNALKGAQKAGVLDAVTNVRRSISLDRADRPIVIMGDEGGSGNMIGSLIVAVMKGLNLGGKEDE